MRLKIRETAKDDVTGLQSGNVIGEDPPQTNKRRGKQDTI